MENPGHRLKIRWCILVMALMILMAGFSLSVCAQEPQGKNDREWIINADELQVDKPNDTYIGIGNVTISSEGRTLTADRIQYDNANRIATAEGNVRLISNGDWLQGDHLRIHLDTEVGQLTGGTLFSSENHLYLSSEKIHKTGPNTYWAQKAVLTSCDGDRPAWRISANDLKITVEGYGFAKHAAFWARRVPVLYSPFLAFPVKIKRQTGLLTPQMGYSSRKGTEYLQPFFWAINQSSDATVYGHTMSERGIRAGVEYRYKLSEASSGILLAEGLRDDKVDDGTGTSSEDWGYGDDPIRPNEERYWLRGKVNQELPADFKAKLDIDVVSDQDYLHEFKNGLFGFTNTRDNFINTFGRDVDDYTDSVRTNKLNVSRGWSKYALNMDLIWNDDVVKRQQKETDNTLNQMPKVSFKGTRQPAGPTPLFFDLTSSYTHFYRQDGDRGHRADLYPRLYYPLYVLQGVSLEPSVGFRQTAWRIDEENQESDETYHRALYDIGFNAKTEFYRVFGWQRGGYDRLKHAITPELDYIYIPETKREWPKFDSIDNIKRKNLVTLNLINNMTLRKPTIRDGETVAHDYLQFLRFKLSQSFDIHKYNEEDPEPFSDLGMELDLTPGRVIRVDAEADWSLYDTHFNTASVLTRLWNRRGDSIEARYSYTREGKSGATETIDNIRLLGNLVVTRQWSLRAGYEFNREDQEVIETRVGATYQSQCWALDLDFSEEGDDRRYTFMIHLSGLGGFGN
jgi:LPS-assembly protein